MYAFFNICVYIIRSHSELKNLKNILLKQCINMYALSEKMNFYTHYIIN